MPSASEKAYEQIREGVTSGRYTAGDRLREEELSSIIGVSRTPIREALRRLTAEGLVEFLPHRGAHVASWTNEQLNEIFEFRALIEGHGAKRAASRISQDAIQRLTDLADAMEEAVNSRAGDSLETIAELNNEFHHIVASNAGSEHLLSFFAKVVQIPLVHRTFRRYRPPDLVRSFQHHRELIDAFVVRDAAWAETVMISHILAARHIFEPTTANGDGGTRVSDGADGVTPA